MDLVPVASMSENRISNHSLRVLWERGQAVDSDVGSSR